MTASSEGGKPILHRVATYHHEKWSHMPHKVNKHRVNALAMGGLLIGLLVVH
jgi:hypothetical protein